MNNKTYIHILADTLNKKTTILDKLIQITNTQDSLLKEQFNMDQFEETLPQKDKLINQLNELDIGFERIYDHVKDEFSNKQNVHQEEIVNLQRLIRQVMEKSSYLQSLEVRNKIKIETFLSGKKNEIRSFKKNSKTASSYYKNMANQHQYGDSYFLDKKK